MKKLVTVFSIKEQPDLSELGYSVKNMLDKINHELMSELKEDEFATYLKETRKQLDAKLDYLAAVHEDRRKKIERLREVHAKKAVRTENHKPTVYYTKIEDERKFLYLSIYNDGDEIHVVHEKVMKLYIEKRLGPPTIVICKRTYSEIQLFADEFNLIINT